MSTVTITTGSRLHFGPLCVSAPAGGRFGGVGLMIDAPCLVLSARPAEVDVVHGDSAIVSRIEQFLRSIRQVTVGQHRSGCEITVVRAIPSHCGFGSGTQLGLAVARAASLVADEPEPSLETLARRVGRGLRSAIGLHGFQQGGFLVDGGRTDSDRLGTLVSRVAFPADWRIVLAMPQSSCGLSGAAEQAAFANQSAMPGRLTAELCRIVLMDWLTSVIEADFDHCSAAMYQYGHAVGEFFSPVQGGVFANQRMCEWAELVRRRGIEGVAQTSWGPALAVLCPSERAARQLQQDFATDPAWTDCSFDVAAPLNRGALITRDHADSAI